MFRRTEVAHAGEQFVAVLAVPAALPFGQPDRREIGPIGAKAEPGRIRPLRRPVDQLAGRIDRVELRVHLEQLAHEVADAFVGSEVVIEAPVGGGADAHLLGAAAPMLDVMTRAEAGKAAEMVDIHLAGVASHRLGEAKQVRPAGTQVGIPEPEIRREFRIVPGVTAHVVAPHVAVAVVGVHDVAIVPEAVPMALLHLLPVIIELPVEAILDRRLGRRGAVGQAPQPAKHAGAQQVGRRTRELRRRTHAVGQFDHPLARRCGRQGPERDFAGAGDAVGCAPAGLVILVGDLQPAVVLPLVRFHAHHIMVEPEVHRGRLGRP